jgi:hypothetical protein
MSNLHYSDGKFYYPKYFTSALEMTRDTAIDIFECLAVFPLLVIRNSKVHAA